MRCFIVLYFLFGLFFESFAPIELALGIYEKYFTFFTNWSWWLLALHALVGIVVSIRGIRTERHRMHTARENSHNLFPKDNQVHYDWLDKTCAAFTATMLPISLFITVAYWGGVHNYSEKVCLSDRSEGWQML
jgi:hypothetical protein